MMFIISTGWLEHQPVEPVIASVSEAIQMEKSSGLRRRMRSSQ